MSTVVGTLQVDVTTGQATFTFDEAKKQLDSFGNSAKGASEKLDYSMREARESVTLTSETLGVHLPGGIARAIASIGPLGPALEAAMPVVAIVAAIALIVGAYEKLRAEAEKTAVDQTNAGSAVLENLRGLDDKFLQAGIKADELRGNHLAALNKEIKLIDNQTLSDLEHEFETLGKVADGVFEDLKSHWYTLGSGSQHAKYNLDEYEATYRNLLDTKGEPAANAYLQQQVKYEQQILDLQKQVVASKGTIDTDEKEAALQQKLAELKKAGTGATDKEIQAQQELVDTLNAQVTAQQKINATAGLEKHNDTAQYTKQANDLKIKSWQQLLAVQEKYTNMLRNETAEQEKRASEAGNKSNEAESIKRLEAYYTQLAEAEKNVAKAQEDLNTTNKTNAIDNQIAAYKRLAEQGLITERQLAADLKPLYQQETDDKIAAIQAEIATQNQIVLAAQTSGDAIRADKAVADEIKLQAQLAKIRQQGVQQQAALDQQMNAQWQNAVKQMETGFTNSIGKTIVEGKNVGQAMRQVAAQFLEAMISANIKWLISTITTNQARATSTIASGEAATQASLAQSLTLRFDAAKTAAAKAMTTVPFPLDLVVAPLVFAAALAFAGGGIVPGSGYGDTVPAMLTPGEAVLPQPMVEKLSTASGTGGDHFHAHFSPTVHAKMWDSSDLKEEMLNLKNDFIKHAEKEFRRRHK